MFISVYAAFTLLPREVKGSVPDCSPCRVCARGRRAVDGFELSVLCFLVPRRALLLGSKPSFFT